ncbi:hypothetical protein [Chania multitudinisentens]|uniref:hypothetical protein n=1 Tax=Chania multitudinisentens TaxID=1639108 RepID=UPI0004B7473B|nr:hypothetical protein [Chania multitudinisentens]
MMASPTKLTLGPGQKRDINLVVLTVPQKEVLYRLYIVPVSSIKVVGDESKDKIKAPLTFGVAYGVVVHHLPPAGAQIRSWNHQCSTEGMQLSATGNVNILFRELQQRQQEPLRQSRKYSQAHPVCSLSRHSKAT